MKKTLINEYLNPETLSKISNLELRAKLVVEGFITGLHKSPFHGFSVEFSQHRQYNPGDSLRFIDWKVYGRTDRFYIKQYEEETNLKAYILLDISNSMSYSSSGISKIEYGKYLSAALSYLFLMQRDATGLCLFDSAIRKYVPPKSVNSYLQILITELENSIPGTDTDVGSVLHAMADRIKRRGLIIIISDLLDAPEKIISGLRHFRHGGHEVLVFHLLDQMERNFEFSGDIVFHDLESEEKIRTDPWFIKKEYQQNFNLYLDFIQKQCRENRIDYKLIETKTSLDVALIEYLIKRNRLI